MNTERTVFIDGRQVPIGSERNLLELIRGAGIDLPTFCYHSELSIYGACRLCLVEVEGRGIVASCSTPAEPGLRVHTHTEEIREIRRIALELILANHEQDCPTCSKNGSCRLQSLARRLGVTGVRFKHLAGSTAIDDSSPSLVRDPGKCILCGDCVRMCSEIQGIGAIDFSHRGHEVQVLPAFGKNLDEVECVNCGQCAAVCPTGAITPKSEVREVWKAIEDPARQVIVQIAPAVRVAVGEAFGLAPGELNTGRVVAALKAMGFSRVFDTCFAADLTVIEEGNEFLGRVQDGGALPLFTSCCPAWVKFAEQYYPDLLPNLSTCRSPQQMFGSMAREILPGRLGVAREKLVIVSVMPCTAKKFEARRPEFSRNGIPDVDYVLTTQELVRMIEEYGLDFASLQPESLDLPLGFKTGAGVIFGTSGGVSEAVLRYVGEKMGRTFLDAVEFHEVRGREGLREAELTLDGHEVRLAIVHGLANARRVAEEVRAGRARYHLIEAMACPGGCVGGAGQPISMHPEVREARTRGLYEADRTLQLHKAQDNPYIQELYRRVLDGPEQAHELLHTAYTCRKRIAGEGLSLAGGGEGPQVEVDVCIGTSCYLRGSQKILNALAHRVEERGLAGQVAVKATFCYERCSKGPTLRVGDVLIEGCTLEKALAELDRQLERQKEAAR